MKKLIAFLLLTAGAARVQAQPCGSGCAESFQITIATSNSQAAIKSLSKKAGTFQALVLRYDSEHITVRVPRAKSAAMLETLRSTGRLTKEDVQREDLGEQLSVLRSEQEVRKNSVEQLSQLAGAADFESARKVEVELEEAIANYEDVQGRLRKAQRRAQWSDFEVNVSGSSLKNRTASVYSKWNWINALGIEDLIGG